MKKSMQFTRGGLRNGTGLVGYVETTYEDLKEAFGLPYDRNGDKTTCEWVLTFGDGQVATIYDWKMERTPIRKYRWHIGGKCASVVDRIETHVLMVTV
jgi:hypothetical protein